MMLKTWLNVTGITTARGVQLRFIGIIAIAIGLTLIQSITPFIKIRSLDENRNLAALPDIVGKITHGNGRIAPDINAWFDDHIGFRSILTRLANQIDYSVFGFSKKVLIGKDGWYFDPEFFTAELNFSRTSDQLAVERQKMVALSEFLKRRNIRLVVIATPAKETVYREFLPVRTPLRPAISEFDKFRDYLKAGDGREWIYIDSQEIFTRAKSDGIDIYFRTDLHATTYGTSLVTKEMINRLAEAEHSDLRWNRHLDLASGNQLFGSNLRFLSIFSNYAEEILEPRTRYDSSHPPPGEFFEKSPAKPFEVIFHNDADHVTLARTVLFGNSFMDRNLQLGAYSFFRDLYRVRGSSDAIGEALRAIPPGTRNFIFQFWEPHLILLRAAKIPPD